MASLLIDKLENLKSNEIKLKEEQRVLEEQIAFEMEKKRRMKMDATLTKLEVQIDELAENFEGVLMPNNFQAVLYKIEQDFQKDLTEFHKSYKSSGTYAEKYKIMRERETNLRKKKQKFSRDTRKKITLGEFQNNLNLIDEETKATWLKTGLPYHSQHKEHNVISLQKLAREQLLIPPEVKIYIDIVPLFRTMMGIMEKQQREINELKVW